MWATDLISQPRNIAHGIVGDPTQPTRSAKSTLGDRRGSRCPGQITLDTGMNFIDSECWYFAVLGLGSWTLRSGEHRADAHDTELEAQPHALQSLKWPKGPHSLWPSVF